LHCKCRFVALSAWFEMSAATSAAEGEAEMLQTGLIRRC
jgi:hypothetical protein